MPISNALLKTIWVYSTAGGFYVIVNAWVHPESLSWQLTHLTPWLREDTFGMICLLISAASFYWLQVANKQPKN